MKKFFLSIFVMASVILFSACGFNNSNNDSKPTEPVIENNQAPVKQSVTENKSEKVRLEKTQKEENNEIGDTTVLNEGKTDLLALSTAPNKNGRILSQKEENGIIYRTGEKINEDGSKVQYKETGKKQGPDSMIVKRVYDDGRRVMLVIKIQNNKRYAKLYVLYPDGTKDTAEVIATKNNDGTLTTKYIKRPEKGYFL